MIENLISYRLQNLRSIKDSKTIELPSLSVLVGKNGSGKSSFLRFFQVLQQSIGEAKKVPLLFYGKDVDLGSFDDSIYRFCTEDKYIGFEFRFASERVMTSFRASIKDPLISCRIKQEKKSTYVSSARIEMFDDNINIDFTPSGKIEKISVNEIDFTQYTQYLFKRSGFNFVLPSYTDRNIFEKYSGALGRAGDIRHRTGLDLLIKKSRVWAGLTAKTTTLYDIINIPYTNHSRFISTLQKVIDLPLWKKRTLHLTRQDKDYREFRACLIFSIFPGLLSTLDEAIYRLSSSVYYIGPVRATAQRYYRYQDLDVSKIDSSGFNVSTFINSMSESDFDSFRNWVNIYFSFKPRKINIPGHVAINISDGNDILSLEEDYNMADVGFGYSQVLPILLQLWQFISLPKSLTGARRYSRGFSLFLIEQPELHLHPSFQSKLVRAFVDTIQAVKQQGRQLKLIIETHSETIINELGRSIDDGKISEDNVAVYLFEKEKGCCEIRKSSFTKDGTLENWPFGFFSGD